MGGEAQAEGFSDIASRAGALHWRVLEGGLEDGPGRSSESKAPLRPRFTPGFRTSTVLH